MNEELRQFMLERLRVVLPRLALDAEFDESKVKRDHGKFASQEGAGAAAEAPKVSRETPPKSEGSGSKPKDDFAALLARSRADTDARAAKAAKIVSAGGSVKLTSTRRPEHSALVGPDMSEPGKFRITRFDEQGPFGHTVYSTYKEAVTDALREGYEPKSEGSGAEVGGKSEGSAKPSWHQEASGKWTGEKPRTFYRGTNPDKSETRRIATGETDWDSHLFASSELEGAKAYGSSIETIEAKPEAKILYEGSPEFKKLGKGLKGSLLDVSSGVAKRAKLEGYDAVWFQRQTDVGTAIMNPDAFTRGGGKAESKGEHPGHGYSPEAELRDGVIHTTSVNDAVRALYEDRKVSLKQPRQVSTLVSKLSDIAKRMERLGSKAPNFDLCNVSVEGTNLFCAKSKGIPRAKMPQIPTAQVQAFRDFLKDKGFTSEDAEAPVSYLKATQDELVGAKVSSMMKHLKDRDPSEDSPLFVSSDDYIMDGHHRWAARVGLDAGGDLGKTKVKVIQINLGIIDLLEQAETFTGGKGHKEAKAEARDQALDAALTLPPELIQYVMTRLHLAGGQ